MPYEFDYSVDDSASVNLYGHQENKNGEVVKGSYFVLLPDGRLQTVKYRDEGAGFVAQVSYDNKFKTRPLASPVAPRAVVQTETFPHISTAVVESQVQQPLQPENEPERQPESEPETEQQVEPESSPELEQEIEEQHKQESEREFQPESVVDDSENVNVTALIMSSINQEDDSEMFENPDLQEEIGSEEALDLDEKDLIDFFETATKPSISQGNSSEPTSNPTPSPHASINPAKIPSSIRLYAPKVLPKAQYDRYAKYRVPIQQIYPYDRYAKYRTVPAQASQYGLYDRYAKYRTAPPQVSQYGVYDRYAKYRTAPAPASQYGVYDRYAKYRTAPAPASQYGVYDRYAKYRTYPEDINPAAFPNPYDTYEKYRAVNYPKLKAYSNYNGQTHPIAPQINNNTRIRRKQDENQYLVHARRTKINLSSNAYYPMEV